MSADRNLITTVALGAIVTFLSLNTAHAEPKIEVSQSVRPGDDFYTYANEAWLKATAVPEGTARFGTRAMLNAKTKLRVQDLIKQAATSGSQSNEFAQKVGSYYASFQDTNTIDARGLSSLHRDLKTIAALSGKSSLSGYLGSTLNIESDGMTQNADHVIGLVVNQGLSDADHNYAHLLQGGLSLANRDDYINTSAEAITARAQLKAHMTTLFNLAHFSDPEARAQNVLDLEIAIAKSHPNDDDANDIFKQNNVWRRHEFDLKAPGMDWAAYFQGAGLSDHNNFTILQPSAIIGLAKLAQDTPIETWKDYLSYHLIEHYSIVLPKAFREERARFNGVSSDTSLRDELAIAATNAALGEAVGRLYVERYFPPQAKHAANAMRDNLIEAYRARISNLNWMSPQTRDKALAKLATLYVGLGYPDKWLDYTGLKIIKNDSYGNMKRAESFARQTNIAKLSQKPTPRDWTINPHTPGAVIMFSPNSEFFSAGILQAPYFDANNDAASNYGSAGAGMAHEMSHSFDTLGNIYDAHGRLGLWWTPQDATNYQTMSEPLIAQYNQYCPFSDLCVDGKQVLNENIADLTGLIVAYEAYRLSLKGQTDVVIDGLSGEQRFFIAFSQRWRLSQSEAALRQQTKTDNHAPGAYRSFMVRNMEAWYSAFDIKPEDKLYLKPQDRIHLK